MPELPEVETVKRGLEHLQGAIVTQVDVLDGWLRQPIPSNLRQLEGKKLVSLSRRAKYLVFSFEGLQLVIHLGMTGQLVLRQQQLKHDKLKLDFAGQSLYFSDIRRFGVVDWYQNIDWQELGVEPLSSNFTIDSLKTLLTGSQQNMKQFLLNQKNIAGLGNIYVCEALYQANISPLRTANNLTLKEITVLHHTIIDVLEKAITAGGSTLKDYRQADGTHGYFQHQFLVYGREGQPCAACGRPIVRLKQNGRSSYYCPICQH